MTVKVKAEFFMENLPIDQNVVTELVDVFIENGWLYNVTYRCGYFSADAETWTFEESADDSLDRQKLQNAVSNVVDGGGGALSFIPEFPPLEGYSTILGIHPTSPNRDFPRVYFSINVSPFGGEGTQQSERMLVDLFADLAEFLEPYIGYINYDTSTSIVFEGDFSAPPNGFTGVTYLSYDVPEIPLADLADAGVAHNVVEYDDGVLFEACGRGEGSPKYLWSCDPDEVTDLEEFLGLDYLYQ